MTSSTASLRPGPASVDFDFSLAGRTALVTGGGSGIGAATAAAFVAKGADVVVADRDLAAATSVAADLGVRARAVECDVADRASVEAAVRHGVGGERAVDVLVNSAGIGRLAPAAELSTEAWRETLEVNLTGTFVASQVVGRLMLARGWGRIVNLASQAASVALDGHAAYSASKAGVLGLTRSLAREWGPQGVTVNAISPTVVLTPLGRVAWGGERGLEHQAQIPVGRFALPGEIAAAAVFLASDGAAMVNGHDLIVDGGFTIT